MEGEVNSEMAYFAREAWSFGVVMHKKGNVIQTQN